MATRSIVTFHPDVACDVCGRRLLRGEQPDVFLGDGQRRLVCELCTPRAAHEGWRRESEEGALSLRAARPRRGRSLLGRLRQLREPAPRTPRARDPESDASEGVSVAHEEDLYDFLDSSEEVGSEDLLGTDRVEGSHEQGHADAEDWQPSSLDAHSRPQGEGSSLLLERALEAFNAGEHPRRVAGVARSLGAPSVRVAGLLDSAATVDVLVAWELCWYRYEVDLDEEAPQARLAAQGMELHELPAEDRVANAVADERGELSLGG